MPTERLCDHRIVEGLVGRDMGQMVRDALEKLENVCVGCI
jgi:hypothetical protein